MFCGNFSIRTSKMMIISKRLRYVGIMFVGACLTYLWLRVFNLPAKPLSGENYHSGNVLPDCSEHRQLSGPIFNESMALLNVSLNVSTRQLMHDDIKPVSPGGRYKPADCVSSQKVAVIIPYRDRATHLPVLVNNLHHIMQRQSIQYGIFVCELANTSTFSKGLTMNAGYTIAGQIDDYDCYIFHDVDYIPLDYRNVYTCGPRPRHMVSFSSKALLRGYESGIPYKDYIGGAISIPRNIFEQVNGWTNFLFGWGGTDDDMFQRIKKVGIVLDRVDRRYGRYYHLPHGADVGNPPNKKRFKLMKSAQKRMKVDGLNMVSNLFKVDDIENRDLYTWIKISCNQSIVQELANSYFLTIF